MVLLNGRVISLSSPLLERMFILAAAAAAVEKERKFSTMLWMSDFNEQATSNQRRKRKRRSFFFFALQFRAAVVNVTDIWLKELLENSPDEIMEASHKQILPDSTTTVILKDSENFIIMDKDVDDHEISLQVSADTGGMDPSLTDLLIGKHNFFHSSATETLLSSEQKTISMPGKNFFFILYS